MFAPLATKPPGSRRETEADWFPPVDVFENAQEYMFKVDLPEMEADEVRIVMDEAGLLISGERPALEQDHQTCLRLERPHGYFERRFALPEDANRQEVEAAFSQCVLEVRVRRVLPRTPGGQPTDLTQSDQVPNDLPARAV